MTPPALSVQGVSHAFGATQALRDVSLAAPRGAFVALLGPNGAGKSTLFNLITRLYAARSGRIEICGVDLARDPRAALARIGVVFQSRALDRNLTVAQNLLYQAALYGIGRRAARARAEALLITLGLADRAGAPVRTLSGGQAQRAEIARAMMHEPELLLCDEATAGLDIAARKALVAETHRLAREAGVGVLWATHLVDEIDPEDPVVILHEGRVLAEGVARTVAGVEGLEARFLALTKDAAEGASA